MLCSNYSLFHGEAVCDCVAGITQSSCYPCLKIYVAFSADITEKLTGNVSTLNGKAILYKDMWSINDKVHNNQRLLSLLKTQ